MDSRAKQRLTGAVILVALFVLLVPELLTGPKSPPAIAVAPTEEGLRSYTIDIEPQAGAAQQSTPAPTEPSVALPAVAPAPVGAAPAQAPATTVAESPQPMAPPSAVSQPQPRPQPMSPSPSPSPSLPQSPQPQLPAPAARALVVEAGSFAVQLGSFGSRENAERLVREMKGKGFSAFIAPITSGGRELFRVRVGPAKSRQSAEALATQLQRIGQSGSVVPIS